MSVKNSVALIYIIKLKKTEKHFFAFKVKMSLRFVTKKLESQSLVESDEQKPELEICEVSLIGRALSTIVY